MANVGTVAHVEARQTFVRAHSYASMTTVTISRQWDAHAHWVQIRLAKGAVMTAGTYAIDVFLQLYGQHGQPAAHGPWRSINSPGAIR